MTGRKLLRHHSRSSMGPFPGRLQCLPTRMLCAFDVQGGTRVLQVKHSRIVVLIEVCNQYFEVSWPVERLHIMAVSVLAPKLNLSRGLVASRKFE